MARPRKAPEARRTYKLIVYLSTDEADEAFRAALKLGRDLSEHARALLTGSGSTGRKTTTSSGTARPALP
jgi:hypothetical protein